MNIIIYKKQYKDNICGGMTKTEQSSQDIWPPEYYHIINHDSCFPRRECYVNVLKVGAN